MDDSLRAGLVDVEALREVELFRDEYDIVRRDWPDISSRRRVIHEVVRRMINTQITDLIETTRALLAEAPHPNPSNRFEKSPQMLVAFSPLDGREERKAQAFSASSACTSMSASPEPRTNASRIITELFDAFIADPEVLPDHERAQILALEGESQDSRPCTRGGGLYRRNDRPLRHCRGAAFA